MAQEIMVMGAIYEDVPSVRLPDSNGTFHPFTDTSDTTAVAADVAQGKTFHLADGTLATGTASGGGGGGGASNFVTGTFVPEDTAVTGRGVLEIPYSGEGYLVSLMIYVRDGVVNPEGGYHGVNAKGAVGFYAARKVYADIEPTYSGASQGNQYSVLTLAKRDSTGNTLEFSGSGSQNIVSASRVSDSYPYRICGISAADSLALSIKRVNNTNGYGLLEGVTYGYVAVYSE